MRLILTVWAIGVLHAWPALAQTISVQADSGSRVRVSSAILGVGRQVGTIRSLSRDSLVLQRGGTTAAIAISDISRIEVSTGRKTHAAAHAGGGLLIGGLVGIAFGALTFEENSLIGPQTRSESAFLAGAVLGGLGAIIGFVGGSIPSEKWVPATIASRSP